MSDAPPRLLLVDDDERFRERLARAFRDRGFEVATAGSFAAGLAEARSLRPDKAVLDLRMPGPSGLELLAALRAEQPGLQVVVLTGYGSVATAVEAMRQVAVNYVAKPAHADAILAAFEPVGAPAPDAVPSLARVEWDHINRVLEDCGGNISQAARTLGMHRRTLQRKLAKYPPREG
jgi:two-component system response regulator RegA